MQGERSRRAIRLVVGAAGALAVSAVGVILRLEALVGSYGTVPLGPTIETLQASVARLGPWIHGGRLSWPALGERGGDPLAYLNNARAMTWFYEGRAREPVFNYATKWWLRLTGNADIAVSAASAVFSALCVPATYALGRVAFGRTVGVLAAALIAIDPDMIRWGVQGWRDDAFTFFFLAFGAACLAFRQAPSRRNAVAMAATGSLALLTRLTALSFVAPALLVLWWDAARRRALGHVALPRLALVAVVTAGLVSPYLVNCWTRYGDPFVAVNRNTDFYRARTGEPIDERMRTDVYLASLVRERPVATADTVLQGLTTYPFRNKFHGLAAWHPRLPLVIAVLAIVGMLAWPWSAPGRWLLGLLATALVPYAFTWEIPGGAEWRFTMHAQPIYLIAAAYGLVAGARLAFDVGRGSRRIGLWLPRRAMLSMALGAAVAGTLLWMPNPRFRETLVARGSAVLVPGWRDLVFFRQDWDRPVEEARVTSRTSRGSRARVWLPLVPRRAHRVVASIAPVGGAHGTVPHIRVYVNGSRVYWGRMERDRVSEYAFDIAAGAVGSRINVIEFRVSDLPEGRPSGRPPGDRAIEDEGVMRLQSLVVTVQPE